ncbi:MAG: alpha/beta hydrolase [Isosphaeraceae bacterium]|nr:alpha/beta hydrolase [Isosphaeraceae bacterium]
MSISKWAWAGVVCGVMLMATAGRAAEEPQVVKLWPEGAPGAQGTEAADVPTLTVYLPKAELATGASVVICPGGGYGMHAVEHEGTQVAEWLNSLGVAGFVLKYRLGPRYHHPAMLQDASRAIRTVRARAQEWSLDPKRVGIIGFSAGGHLASTAGTHFDAGKPDAKDTVERLSSRPDVVILIYPVVALATPYAHTGSRRNLLGENPPTELVESLSNETQVTKETPPTFLAHTNADTGVVAENSILFVLALRKAGVPVEFHLFEKGQHGLGLGSGSKQFRIAPDPAFSAWPGLCATWLKGRGFLERTKP